MLMMLAILQALPHDLTGRGEAPSHELWEDDGRVTGTPAARLVDYPLTPASSVIVIEDDTAGPSGERYNHNIRLPAGL